MVVAAGVRDDFSTQRRSWACAEAERVSMNTAARILIGTSIALVRHELPWCAKIVHGRVIQQVGYSTRIDACVVFNLSPEERRFVVLPENQAPKRVELSV